MLELKTTFTTRELRQFAGIWFPLFCGMVGFFCWRWEWTVAAYVIWAIGAALGIIGVLFPAVIRPVYRGLLLATFPIGWVMSHVILGVVYYLVMTPIGLIMRLLGRDPMERRLDRTAATYWVPRQQVTNVERYFRQF
jgi:hypothetical protein